MDSNVSIGIVLSRLIRGVTSAGLGALLLFSSSAWPVVPGLEPDPSDLPVKGKIEAIRAAVVDIQAQLNAMQAGIGQNASDLTALTNQMHEQMDLIDASNNDVFESVNSVEVTTKLCFDSAASLGIKLGGVGEFGANWTKVLHVEAAFELDEFWDLGMGVGNELCIDVPLYSVYWPELEVSQSEGELLYPVIDGFSLVGRGTLPLVGQVSEQVLPPPESVRNVLQAVELAATSGNPDDVRALLKPATYLPMTPPLVATMIESAAILVIDAVIDPCGVIEDSPLFAGIPPATYNWMCFMDPNATMSILKTIADVVDLIIFW